MISLSDADARTGSARMTQDAVVNRPFYLHVGATPVFASATLPTATAARSTAIIFCAPLALPEQMSYRVRRDWAEDLAKHGYTALRFDLQGYGDSADHEPEDNGLDLWLDAVSMGADWLRSATGCTRVVALGIGFGGLLAWAAASRGAAIDDLVLWGAPLKGARLLREIHASATVLIDPRITVDGVGEPGEPQTKDSGLLPGAVLDDAGQAIFKPTADAISALDMKTIPLPEASSRRILLFERTGDDRLREHLQSSGAEFSSKHGDEFNLMMQYVQFSRLPPSVAEDLLSWLEASPRYPVREWKAPAEPAESTSQSIELEYSGTAIRECLVSVEVDGATLRGVLTEPLTGADTSVSGLFFSAGSDRRIGQNRLWVGTARRWAAMGTANVRLDPAGVGESDGECEDNGTLRGRYFDAVIDNTVPILDGVASLGVTDRFMLAGVCSGGWRAARTALIDERVAGVYAVDLPFFRWNWWIVHLRNSWIASRAPRLDEARSRRLMLRTTKVVMRLARPLRPMLIKSRLRSRRNLAALEKLKQQNTQLTCVFRDSSDQLEEMVFDLNKAKTAASVGSDSVTIHVAPGFDPQYRPTALQAHLNATLDDALLRVRGRLSTPAAEMATGSSASRPPTHAC